mgnify:CR=1 FL=1
MSPGVWVLLARVRHKRAQLGYRRERVLRQFKGALEAIVLVFCSLRGVTVPRDQRLGRCPPGGRATDSAMVALLRIHA